jgi:hypothetical protein
VRVTSDTRTHIQLYRKLHIGIADYWMHTYACGFIFIYRVCVVRASCSGISVTYMCDRSCLEGNTTVCPPTAAYFLATLDLHRTIFIGLLFYCGYSGSFLVAHYTEGNTRFSIAVIATAISGVGGGLLWTAQVPTHLPPHPLPRSGAHPYLVPFVVYSLRHFQL